MSLSLMPNGFQRKGPVLLIIMDGVGLGKPEPGNAGDYVLADIPNAGLANVAATLCELLGFQPPANYAPSLIRFAVDKG